MEEKGCTSCGLIKSVDEYYYDKDRGDYRSHCKFCVKSARKNYRETNKAQVYSYNKEYLKTYTPPKRAEQQ